jgi:hypothetical protein
LFLIADDLKKNENGITDELNQAFFLVPKTLRVKHRFKSVKQHSMAQTGCD